MDRVPIPVVVAILLNRRRVFLVRRGRNRPLPNHWEFPGGKVEVDEAPEDALRRELREELGLRVGRLVLFGANAHLYEFPEGPVHYVLLAYRANVRDGAWARRGRWMDVPHLARAKVVGGSRPFVSALFTGRALGARRQSYMR